MQTKGDLQKLIKEKLSDYLFIVVSNRQPYVHTYKKGKIFTNRGAGGVIAALDPIMQACKGTWVVWGNGDADKKVTDSHGKLAVPPENPSYTLRRIWLTKEEEIGYYLGFSNEGIWPLCHTTFNRPVFRPENWKTYERVNEKFADAIIKEIGDKKAFVWIQDYHLCMLPKILRERLGEQIIMAHFWHIPWPGHETFRILPQKKEILESLLANDLMGFHTPYHCNNFIADVERELEAKIDRERNSIVRSGHETLIRFYPISVDYEFISKVAETPEVKRIEDELRDEFRLGGLKVMLGLDRIDYTKGIPERLLAVDDMLTKHPELKEKVVLLQMGEMSRIHIPKYKQLNDEINAIVEQINWKHSTDNWKPIILVRSHLNYPELLSFYRLGDVCVVSSLHDGLNLVAKEFISSAGKDKGMLVLSEFTGAARELVDAVQINPYDREQFSEGLYKALTMPEKERKKRMHKLQQQVKENNIYFWAKKIISDLLKIG
jgi:alpha,alpha-trehalose-phosphate synthase [UDP-forming]